MEDYEKNEKETRESLDRKYNGCPMEKKDLISFLSPIRYTFLDYILEKTERDRKKRQGQNSLRYGLNRFLPKYLIEECFISFLLCD